MPVANKCTRCDARGSGLCDAVPEDGLGRLSAAAVNLSVQPGQCFIAEGDPAEHFFTLTGGTAKLSKMLPDGRQQITSFCGSGDFLGLASCTRYSYAATALDLVRLCRFSRKTLFRLLGEFPAMEQRLLAFTNYELVLAQEQMLLLGRKTARERLATFLIARARAAHDVPATGRRPEPMLVALPMTRAEIGDYLGLQIETVSRTLTQLRLAAIIAIVPRSGIMIHDFAALENLAGSI